MKSNVIQHWRKLNVRFSNYGMFSVICLILFVLPILPISFQAHLFTIGISFIIILSIEATSQHFNTSRRAQVFAALLAIWTAWFTNTTGIKVAAHFFLFVFFGLRVMKFIRELAKRQKVGSDVIVESINGYLLLGIALGFLVSLVCMISAQAFSFEFKNGLTDYYNPYYYAFVTMTTLGYGDCLPLTNAGKAISIFICLAGQLYLVTVMAMLIGRLLTTQNDEKESTSKKQA
ncbi:MAG: potassium channel family protein [Mangrovibacterium sp.]